MIECPFTREVMCMEPEEFIRRISENLHVKYMVVGTDFHFGHQRRGDYRMLEAYAPLFGYQAKIVDKIREDGKDISSTYVRDEIAAGNIGKANQLLGYAFFVSGNVLHGKKMGKAVLGIPTVNLLPPPEKLLPPFGVYISETTWNGRRYQGITNVGVKPSVKGEHPVGVETHLFGVSEDMYGEEIRVSFLKCVRPEQKFESLEALKAQMEQDIQYAKMYFNAGKGVRKN